MITTAARKLAYASLISGAFVANAVAITVDGNLSDLIAAPLTNPFTPYNDAAGTDPNGDGDGPGFDITNTYVYYDVPLDTFYFGMSFAGAVGTSGGDEGSFFGVGCGGGFSDTGTAGLFDASPCELYGFNLSVGGVGTNVIDMRISGDSIAANGLGSASGLDLAGSGASGAESLDVFSNAYGATVSWAVGDGGGGGVEFSVTGLKSILEPMSVLNPRDVSINFFAGSALNSGPEDIANLNVQVVPIPAAVWLFGSGLFGLAGLAARRRKAQ